MGHSEADFEQAKAHFLLGLEHMEAGHWAEAERDLRTSLQWLPDRPSTLTNLAACLIRLERHQEAQTLLTRSLALESEQPLAWLNLGLVEASKKDFIQAIGCYEKALALDPQDAQAWSNKGLALSEVGRMDEALKAMGQAVALDPDRAEYWSNRAVVWAEKGAFDAALSDHDQALALAPDDGETRYNKALLLLRLKHFKEGFDLYESRWSVAHFGGRPLISDVPRWHGQEPVRDLLLWAEQGVGDEILYASMLSALDYPEVSVTLAVDPRLVGVFQRSFPSWQVIDRAQAQRLLGAHRFQAQAAFGALGGLLQMTENKIRGLVRPYLKSDSVRRAAFRQQLNQGQSRWVCGVSWSSKNRQIGDDKSIALSQWAELLRTPDVTFVNLQYGDVAPEIRALNQSFGCRVHQVEGLDLHDDIEGALALVDACDAVITTSNVTAHLAGALGQKGCVLIPRGKGKIWYWHDTDDASMWYPSLRLLHQKEGSDWTCTLQEARQWLVQTCTPGPGS